MMKKRAGRKNRMNYTGNSKQLYKNIKWIREGFQPKMNTCKMSYASTSYVKIYHLFEDRRKKLNNFLKR